MFSRISQKKTKKTYLKKSEAVLSQLNVLKILTFNDEGIYNGLSLKVEAMILSSIVILFGWSLRLSLKLKLVLTEPQ